MTPENSKRIIKADSLFLFVFVWFLLTPFVYLSQAHSEPAADRLKFDERLIAGTFKSLARAFLFAVDINKLKNDNIQRITKMSDEKYARKYAKAYLVIKDCPTLRERYGFTQNTAKKDALKVIRSLDKNKIYVIIDLVPDAVIALEFKQYLRARKQDVNNSDPVKQATEFWVKVCKKIYPANK